MKSKDDIIDPETANKECATRTTQCNLGEVGKKKCGVSLTSHTLHVCAWHKESHITGPYRKFPLAQIHREKKKGHLHLPVWAHMN